LEKTKDERRKTKNKRSKTKDKKKPLAFGKGISPVAPVDATERRKSATRYLHVTRWQKSHHRGAERDLNHLLDTGWVIGGTTARKRARKKISIGILNASSATNQTDRHKLADQPRRWRAYRLISHQGEPDPGALGGTEQDLLDDLEADVGVDPDLHGVLL